MTNVANMVAKGDFLQTIRTFLFLKDAGDEEIEQGFKRESLRGTFSMMEFDENSKAMLDDLKAKFMNFKKDLGGLDMQEFEVAIKPVISAGISQDMIQKTFQKMDTCDQGAVSWDEFMNFAIEEHSKRIMMNETMDEMPFGSDLVRIKHHHRDPIMRITFMPTVDPNSKEVDWGYGKYMILSREGQMSVWSANMRSISYNDLSGTDGLNNPVWFLDLVAIYHNGTVATATTARDIGIYDYTRRGWSRKYRITKLNHCVCCMTYNAVLTNDEHAVIIWGDTSGSVTILTFDLSQRLPLFGIAVREGCTNIDYRHAYAGDYEGTTVRVYPNIHGDWVKHVQYVPENTAFLSCCNDTDTGMYMSHLDPAKKPPVYFNTHKGIMCFDYSHSLNILACAGVDCSIWLYNPYIPSKVVAMMEGHIRPVVHLKINAKENYVISVDLSKTIFMHHITSQRVIQRIPGQSVRMGLYPINTIYLNSERRMCLLGTYCLAMLKRQRLEGLHVEIRSHDRKLVGAMYSPEFQQVVSVCRGSMVRVWDVTTGTRVMQFGMAHKKKSQGRWVPVEIECVTLTENKRRLCTAAEGVVKIWNFNVGSAIRELNMSNCPKITSIVMAKKMFYVTGWSKVINVFSDFKGEEEVKKTWQAKHPEDILNLCVMEPNLIASSSYDGSIVVWSRETTESYCKLSAIFGNKPEIDTSVRAGGKGNAMAVADDEGSDEEGEKDEDAFMTIGKHLRKEGGWYRGLRALKKRQIEREKRRAAAEKKDFTARYRKKKKRLNMQGLTLIYESAVECMCFLSKRRTIDPQTATLVAAGAECWLRFWSLHPRGGLLGQFTCTRRKLESIRCMVTDSENEFLFTGDTMGLLRIFDIKEFCNAVKLTNEEREDRRMRLMKEFVYRRLPFNPEEMLDSMEKLRVKKISAADASKPRKNLMSPPLLSSIRAHTEAIVSLEFIQERDLILTASQDLTVRLWTKNCSYIGTFGGTWAPIPFKVGPIVEKEPNIPKDLLRVASAHTLGTLHNGHMPHWKKACYVVRRHIYEQKRERQIEEARQKMKAERRERGEVDSDDDESTVEGEKKQASKILGKYYQPRHRYRGPMTIEDQGYKPLRVFRGKLSPYNTAQIQVFRPMDPLYRPPTFFDIDTRRPGPRKRNKRHTTIMMNTFNHLCGADERFGGTRGTSMTTTPSSHSQTSGASISNERSTNSIMNTSNQNNQNQGQVSLLARTAIPDEETLEADISSNRKTPSFHDLPFISTNNGFGAFARDGLEQTMNTSYGRHREKSAQSHHATLAQSDIAVTRVDRTLRSALKTNQTEDSRSLVTDWLHSGDRKSGVDAGGKSLRFSLPAITRDSETSPSLSDYENLDVPDSDSSDSEWCEEEKLTLPEIQLNRRIALYKKAGLKISHLL